jgi:hypothetical protein
MAAPHWTQVLTLRPEVTGSEGSVGELQMSLHKAVYQTVDVPYRKVDYYSEITQPTPQLVGFLGRLARRLGTGSEGTALFHLDQGMGGGKSHALVGAYHMAANPEAFFDTELGQLVQEEAEQGGVKIDLTSTHVVTLCADHFSPGAPSENFGPATNLFERFLWGLLGGDRDAWDRFVAQGPNKGTLQQALASVSRPVLILLDELMDYVMALSDAKWVDSMPTEKAFLNALMDACDDIPQVAFVVVMIRSEFDERGYTPHAVDFRDYVAARLVRNGTTVAVTESQDFASIIRRRLFETPSLPLPGRAVAGDFVVAAADDPAWEEKVLDKLGGGRGLTGLADRVEDSYPFHPDLMALVQQEWSQVQGFQRVRSTVAIFALTALHWVNEAKAGRWSPALIGVGDIPLTRALEALLSSGLLLGNDRAIQGYRAVATTDITTAAGDAGRAVSIDTRLAEGGLDAGQPAPAVRMATALFSYSLVARPQGRRGATQAELLAALFGPSGGPATAFTAAEEVFNQLIGPDGLGAIEMISSPNAPARYWLSIKQTLRMYFNSATQLVHPPAKGKLVWETAQALAVRGRFAELFFVEEPDNDHNLANRFSGVDTDAARLVVLDPRAWALLNGRDTPTRDDVRSVLGVSDTPLVVDNAASCVIACVNTQRRTRTYQAAGDVLAWRHVVIQTADADEDERREVARLLAEAERKLKTEVQRAFQHYAYLTRDGDTLDVAFRRFDDDKRSTLNGSDVWDDLVNDGRAVQPGGLAQVYVATLLKGFSRWLTPREVVQSFFKNPQFPLVSSTDEIRRVLAQLLRPAGSDGPGTGGWELVDADGNHLNVTSADQIAINSINQTLRPYTPPDAPEPQPKDAPTATPAGGTAGGQATQGAFVTDDGPVTPATVFKPAEASYKRYIVELDNRSLRDAAAREAVWKLVRELAKVVDPAADQLHHELITLRIELNTAEGHQGQLEARATELGARVRVEEDEF